MTVAFSVQTGPFAVTPIHAKDSIFIYRILEFNKFHLCDREK
ncbi:hypothetical protein BLAT2472_90177 [Burkholderia latens]